MASAAKQQKVKELPEKEVNEARQKKSEKPTDKDVKPDNLEDQQTMFPPTDVTLLVEEKPFHLNKKWLGENSPVFKTMFESEFEEKHAKVIPLPGKKFKDFEMFLSSFYFPRLKLKIKEDTVLVILPLADEYQVLSVINKCEACLVEIFQESRNVDVHMFLRCVNYAERYNLSQVLSAAPGKGTEFTMLSMKNAGIDKDISTQTRMDIYEEKCKLMESFLERFITHSFNGVGQFTFGFSGQMKNGISEKFEDIFVDACDLFPMMHNDADVIVNAIVTAQRFSLKRLKEHAIVLASNFSLQELRTSKNYQCVSKETRKILEDSGYEESTFFSVPLSFK